MLAGEVLYRGVNILQSQAKHSLKDGARVDARSGDTVTNTHPEPKMSAPAALNCS